ncbi:MAG TPA: TIGR03086 family metal-binding protein [Jiangellaceae bacterium]|nr:TIGR03086 family metal-binding protein [Jiangellaceae bacterium]
MQTMLDLRPAASEMSHLVAGITTAQLSAPTPCADYSLATLLDHIDGLSQAFAAAARKDLGSTSHAPAPDGTRLVDDWPTRIPEHLNALVDAWQNPDAWEGTTRAGGVDLPAEAAGTVALNELVLHGWDVARASGQPYDPDPHALQASMEFVSAMAAPDEAAGREGLFGPVVDVPADASLLDRVLGLSGRDPSWRAG